MRLLVLGAMMAAGAIAAADAQATSDTAIRAMEQAQVAAWNAHDIAAYVRPFSADAQFVSASGHWWHGRDETEQKLGYAFRTLFAQSTLHVDNVEVTSLGPDTAIVHNSWTMEGTKRPDGSDTGPLQGVQSQTLRLVGGTWQIVAAQDTLVLASITPPPAAAPAPAAAATTPAAKPERPCLVAMKSGACLVHKK